MIHIIQTKPIHSLNIPTVYVGPSIHLYVRTMSIVKRGIRNGTIHILYDPNDRANF